MDYERGVPEFRLVGYFQVNVPNEPIVFSILKSGWPDMFHVLYEDGAYQMAEHELLHVNAIEKRFKQLKDSPEWVKFKND